MHDNPFIPDISSYKRDLNPIKGYKEQAIKFISRKCGVSLEKAKELVTSNLKTKNFPRMRNPRVSFMRRIDYADRVKDECTLTEYLKETLQNNHIQAPTMTTYVPATEKESLFSGYTYGNVKLRDKYKIEMFQCIGRGDEQGRIFSNCKQSNKKLFNNAGSGALVSSSTPINLPSAHPVLTSNCRMTSAYGNANNEKLIQGNRHYWRSDLVVNNITSIIVNTDLQEFDAVMKKYNLHYPTAEQALECIEYSSNNYWKSSVKSNEILEYLRKLDPVEIAAFVYVGDLYHIKKHNEDFVRTFLKRLSEKVTEGECENPLDVVKSTDDDYINFAHQICRAEMRGKGKEYKAMEGTPELKTLALTTLNIFKVVEEYGDFLKNMFATDNVPASVAHFPTSVRRVVLTSNTDSTIFTVQHWPLWYCGKLEFTDEAIAIANAIIFLASQTIIHILAKMSRNVGVSDENMRVIAMKNEFFFPVYFTANVSNHYYAKIASQEGIIYVKDKMEKKGVNLINSAMPKFIREFSSDLMEEIVDTIYKGGLLEMTNILGRVSYVERLILDNLNTGKTDWFRTIEIKQPSAYKNGEDTDTVKLYRFWNNTFGQKYGTINVLPAASVRVNTTLVTEKRVQWWCKNMDDKELAKLILRDMETTGKTSIPSMLVPADMGGYIPTELVSVIDKRGMIATLMSSVYMILETIGYYRLNKYHTHLVSDYYEPIPIPIK